MKRSCNTAHSVLLPADRSDKLLIFFIIILFSKAENDFNVNGDRFIILTQLLLNKSPHTDSAHDEVKYQFSILV